MWEYYIRQRVPEYVFENPGKLVVAPPIRRGQSQPYSGPSKRTLAKRAAKRVRRSK